MYITTQEAVMHKMSNLRAIRKGKAVSQEELALFAGVTVRYIAFLESGDRKPSIDVALKIAKKLETPVEDIFLLSNSTNRTQGEQKDV
jgi:putative transcriptional regulator